MRGLLVGASGAACCGVLLATRLALAQPQESRAADVDDFELMASSETYAALFRRALLPGPSGSLVESTTAAPVYEYVSLRAERLDVGTLKDALSMEVAAWGRAWPTTRELERPFDGDVQTAFATLSYGPGYARLGRQHVVGGAARFSRFDGALVAARFGGGFEATGYGGFTVLPRWSERVGYHHLGSEADVLLRDPEALEDPERAGEWLAGARFGYRSSSFGGAVSFHEQREQGELARRSLGLDAQGRHSWAALNLNAVLDADSGRFSDARLWADLLPLESLSLSLELLHTEPALWLSRQSVLSVFSSSRFEEAGGSATWRLSDALRLEGASYLTVYDRGGPGSRSEGSVRFSPDRRTVLRARFARVLAAKNGYFSLRLSLSRRLLRATSGTLEAYNYFYDRAVQSYRTSSVYAATVSHSFSAPISLLVGGSLSRTPYASLDAQTLVRLSIAYDRSAEGGSQ